MTTTDLLPPRPSGAPAAQPQPARRGPIALIAVASILTGALGAAIGVLVVPGAPEHVIDGVALLAFAVGWSMLAFLSTRVTSVPQRWAYGLAAFLGTSGLSLLTFAPGDDGLTAAAWVWPPALLGLVIWSARRMRTSAPGRSRWLLYPVLGALAIASVGTFAENIAAQRDASTMTMPGRLYDVGGHRLHLNCTGTGSPTVVLESGLAGNSQLWGRIADGTAATTRVCTYDRAGTGWSENASAPRDSHAVVADLHRLLSVAGEDGPFVLAGHSTGGVYAMTYAAQHPEQVGGLVLLDSATPRQFTVLPDYASQYPMLTRLYAVRPVLERLGIGRLIPALSANEVPGLAGRQAKILTIRPRDGRAARDEVVTYRRSFTQAQALTGLGSKPLVVVSASDTVAGTPGWTTAQQQLTALSSNANQRTVPSSHGGLLDHPTSFNASITAVADVVKAVRSGGAVPTR
ncbi:MAG: alpha/beta hydrolase fold protein [Frankiales bacterium]|nr:alpha/beta hydrolase fold protein [Frankiales bacterium]